MSETDNDLIRAFPPVADNQAAILILGSMPGVASLQADQYYAHPRNAFWRIIGTIFDGSVSTWDDKLALLKQNRLALWDVLKECRRPGSLDSNIQPDSIICNDFAGFFSSTPSVNRIVFNGKTAEKYFLKYVMPTIGQHRLQLMVMPSTSPAMASLNLEQKTDAWREALIDLPIQSG